jgi:hypothetical protein
MGGACSKHGEELHTTFQSGSMKRRDQMVDSVVAERIILKVKVKLSLCLTKHHAMKAYWGVGV